MKRSVILLSLLTIGFFVQAQTPVVVTYSYDANGNQTSRSIQFSKMGENNDSHAFEEEYLTAIHDTVGLIPFSIYPNPTCDQICVERRDQKGMGEMTLYLSTVSGVDFVDDRFALDGQRLVCIAGSYGADSAGWVPARSLCFDRGFTGHEHLMDFGLVNMNGRVYDPVMGTFLSVDNYVQDPSYTQNFNRYAYCMNNPLKYTDPDGEWAHLVIGALIGGIVNLATNWKHIDTFGEGLAYFGIGAAAGAIGAATGGAAAGAIKLGGFISGAVTGSVSGATSSFITGAGNSWMQGANFGQGLWTGIIQGGIGAGIGGLTGGVLEGFVDWRKGYSFWDGTKTINTNTVSVFNEGQNTPPIKQPGDMDCGPSTIEWTDHTMGGDMSFEEASNLAKRDFNGNVLDKPTVKAYCDYKGYSFGEQTKGLSNIQKMEELYTTIQDGGRVCINENTMNDVGHMVGVKSVTKITRLSSKGHFLTNYKFTVMDPWYGIYTNWTERSVWSAYNIMYIKP